MRTGQHSFTHGIGCNPGRKRPNGGALSQHLRGMVGPVYIRSGPVAVGRILAMAALLAIAALALLEWTLRPSLEAVIRHTVQIRATEAISRAVLDRVVRDGVDYSALYRAEKNSDGLITFLQPDTAAINRIATQVQIAVQGEMRRMMEQSFNLSLSQVLGSRLFAARGPAINVALKSIGTVRVSVESRFDQAGLNQTRHLVSLRIRADVQAVTPTIDKVYPIEEQFPLAEGIIVGPVPPGLLNIPNGRW